MKAKRGQYFVLSPANNRFRQGEAELRASEHGIVYLYLAFEANGPFLLIKAKKGRYSVLNPQTTVLGEAKPSCVYQNLDCYRHAAPPEELEYIREAGVF